jgi:hypothetical protein
MHRALTACFGHNVVGMCTSSANSSAFLTFTVPLALQQLRRPQYHAYLLRSVRSHCILSRKTISGPIPTPPGNQLGTRYFGWSFRSQPRSSDSSSTSEGQDNLTKAAILESVMKGRQPTDLMLRCASLFAIIMTSYSMFFRYYPRC